MIGKQDPRQEELFVACSVRELIPDDHILKRVDQVLDLSWLEEEVRDLYCEDNGRRSIPPEAAVRLMLAGFFQGIVHDRKLMREAQVNIAIRWFAGYRLDEKLPDHSSLTRIRQRWGPERFRQIFLRTVRACMEAGLVDSDTVHIDATLIRADVSWESLSTEYAEKVLEENQEAGQEDQAKPPQARKRKKRSRTDPEATLATSRKDHHLEPSFKQHTAVDDASGVILDAQVSTGEASEGSQLLEQIERIEAATGQPIKTVTADTGYAHSSNYQALEEREIEAVIPPPREPRRSKRIPLRRFRYDGKHQVVRCPGGKLLRPRRSTEKGRRYQARAADCASCPLRERCVPPSAQRRAVVIVHGYEALLRARRQRRRWDEDWQSAYSRHRWRVEGVHGEAKTQHGLGRAARRGLVNVAIQAYLTAAVINLKRLARLSDALFDELADVVHDGLEGLLHCLGRLLPIPGLEAARLSIGPAIPLAPAHCAC